MTLNHLIDYLNSIKNNYGGELNVCAEDPNYKKYELGDYITIRLASSEKDSYIAFNVLKRIKGKQYGRKRRNTCSCFR